MRINTILSSVAALLLGLGMMFSAPAKGLAESKEVTMHFVDDKGEGAAIGTITFTDGKEGLDVMMMLEGLPPGERGFHLHENASCMPAEKDGKMVPALAAGGHYDPQKTGKHMGPGKGGHAGDMPPLLVNEQGVAKEGFTLKGLTVKDIAGRSVMIHAGGDNFSDQPMPLGGGGARIACGVIK